MVQNLLSHSVVSLSEIFLSFFQSVSLWCPIARLQGLKCPHGANFNKHMSAASKNQNVCLPELMQDNSQVVCSGSNQLALRNEMWMLSISSDFDENWLPLIQIRWCHLPSGGCCGNYSHHGSIMEKEKKKNRSDIPYSRTICKTVELASSQCHTVPWFEQQISQQKQSPFICDW